MRARRGAARDHRANLGRVAESCRIPRADQPASGDASGQPLDQGAYPGRNPACAFVWEIRNNKEGALAKSSDAQYAKALDATDALKDLWEDEPWLDELQIAKALIAQIVLLDDDLRAKVLKRANLMAKECADTLAPYLRG